MNYFPTKFLLLTLSDLSDFIRKMKQTFIILVLQNL